MAYSGDDVHAFAKKMMEGREVLEESAEATLVLILKEGKPSSMRRFRLLSLCNVINKLVFKVIVNMLKGVLKDLISPC